MHTLRLDRYHCIEDTDEGGFTSPAFLTCVIDLASRTVRAALTPRARWMHKSDKAEVWAVDQLIRSGPAPAVDQLFLLATMLEVAPPAELRGIESALTQNLQAQLACRPRPQPQEIAAALASTLLIALAPAFVGSDPQPVRLMPVPGRAGVLPPLSFPGRTGIYKVWYRESV